MPSSAGRMCFEKRTEKVETAAFQKLRAGSMQQRLQRRDKIIRRRVFRISLPPIAGGDDCR